MLMPLRALIFSLDARETCPQIELAGGDDVTALVLRHLEPLSEGDLARLRTFAVQYDVQWWLQPKGPDTVHLLDEGGTTLAYALPDFGISMPFKPTDFTQVNPHINRVLVSRALRLLAVERHERVIDWFCGLGNFTLPLATQAREVLGIEGSETLVARSRENYEKNKADPSALRSLCATEFVARNLFEMTPAMLVADGSADKWLVDPPREGAFALAKAVADLHQARIGAEMRPLPPGAEQWTPPASSAAGGWRDAGLLVHLATGRRGPCSRTPRIVYVSCKPAAGSRGGGDLATPACWCTGWARLRRAAACTWARRGQHVGGEQARTQLAWRHPWRENSWRCSVKTPRIFSVARRVL
jgi:23S rRNA (uracil1939-C5)-methyltransferase